MFRFDGLKLQESLLYVNKVSCNYWRNLPILLLFNGIYFCKSIGVKLARHQKWDSGHKKAAG